MRLEAIPNPGVSPAAAASSVSSGNGYFGGFIDAASQRLAELPVAVPFVLPFNSPVALSMMLAGVVWHRRGGLASLRAVQSFQRRGILIAALVALIISSLTALVLLDSLSGARAAPTAVSAGASLVACMAAPLVSAGLVLLFVEHADRHRFGKSRPQPRGNHTRASDPGRWCNLLLRRVARMHPT